MVRYKVVIGYDGTNFAGFQRQNNHRTVQGELENTLKKINSGRSIEVYGAGRTDSGVHALGQVIHFDMDNERDEEKLRFALDTQTPDDISVFGVYKVDDNFHSRYSPHEKCYRYTIDLNKAYNPLFRTQALHYRYDLNLDLIEQAITQLEGTHDFTSFCAAGSQVVDKVRTIYKISLNYYEDTNILTLTFYGNGFLYKMIRNIVGVLLAVGNQRIPVTDVSKILQAKDRNLCPATADAHGLCLLQVNYK